MAFAVSLFAHDYSDSSLNLPRNLNTFRLESPFFPPPGQYYRMSSFYIFAPFFSLLVCPPLLLRLFLSLPAVSRTILSRIITFSKKGRRANRIEFKIMRVQVIPVPMRFVKKFIIARKPEPRLKAKTSANRTLIGETLREKFSVLSLLI